MEWDTHQLFVMVLRCKWKFAFYNNQWSCTFLLFLWPWSFTQHKFIEYRISCSCPCFFGITFQRISKYFTSRSQSLKIISTGSLRVKKTSWLLPYLTTERQARALSTFRSRQQGFCKSWGQELNQHCAGLESEVEGIGVASGAGEDLKDPTGAGKAPCPADSLLLSLPPPFGPVKFLWKKERENACQRLLRVSWLLLVYQK